MKKKWTTAELTIMALLVALLSASSYIFIPLPFTSASITAQTLVVNLIGLLLAPGQAVVTVLAWILAGFAGLPVFTGGTAGAARVFGPTGGYMFGYLIGGALISRFRGRNYHFFRYSAVTILIGIPVIYLFGAAYMKFVTGMELRGIFISAILPFIPMDIVKCIAAAYIAAPIKQAAKRAGAAL